MAGVGGAVARSRRKIVKVCIITRAKEKWRARRFLSVATSNDVQLCSLENAAFKIQQRRAEEMLGRNIIVNDAAESIGEGRKKEETSEEEKSALKFFEKYLSVSPWDST